MTKAKKYILLLFLLISIPLFSQEYSVKSVPNPKTADATHFVSNPDGILKDSTVRQINTMLQSLETDVKAEVAVVLLSSIGSEVIEDFGMRLFAEWGIGKKKLDNGLLILFVLDQRAVRFEVGYGLEGVLPDGICKRIQTQAMIPEFKNGNYDAGILAGVEQAVAYIRKEPLPENMTYPSVYNDSILIIPIIIFYIILASIFFSRENKKINKIINNNSLVDNQQRYEAYVNMKDKDSAGCLFFGSCCILPMLGFIMLFVELYIGITLIAGFLTFIPQLLYKNKWEKKFRWQPVICPSCGTKMNVVPEKETHQYIDVQTNMENTLKSIFVDVFLCENCHKTVVYKYDNEKSKYKKCPQCNTKAMYLAGTKTIIQATYTSSGKEEELYICKYCQHEEREEKTTPHLTRSSSSGSSRSSDGGSSSSSGSFSGGHSGGGGSTSRW